MFIAALFAIAKIWKQPMCRSMEWMDKDAHTHTHTRIYRSVYKMLTHIYETYNGITILFNHK